MIDIEALKKLDVKNGDVIYFELDDQHLPSVQGRKAINDYLASRGYGDCALLFVRKGIKVESLSEVTMNKLGWYRKNE